MVANRVSYHLDLRGPSIPLDTACSSTLHATYLAVQALRNGDCEAAVVGGCQLNHRCARASLISVHDCDNDVRPQVFGVVDVYSRGDSVSRWEV